MSLVQLPLLPGQVDVDIDCSVIVVSYNSIEDLDALLQSLAAAGSDVRLAVTVVDNASRDDVGPTVARHPGVSLVRAPANLGYSGGINLGIRSGPPSRAVLILNPDIVVMPGAVPLLLEAALAHGASVPLMRDETGHLSLSLRREPTLLRAFGEAVLGDVLGRRPSWLAEMVRDPSAYRSRHAVDWATGAAIMVSREAAAAVGDWDAGAFFLYSEETDFCRRLRDNGYSVWFVNEAEVAHRGAGSGSSPELSALLALNRIRYFGKHHGLPATVAFAWCVLLHHLLRAGRPTDRRVLATLLSRRLRMSLPGERERAAR